MDTLLVLVTWKIIYDLLKDIGINERIEKYKQKHKIWHIIKNIVKEHDFDEDNDTSLGMKISVYQETINKEFDEYLVNFNYFTKLMIQYGFEVERVSIIMILK